MAIPLFSIGKERSVTVGNTTTVVLPANSSRVFARLTNDSNETIYLMLHEEAKLNYGIRLEATGNLNNFWEINNTNLYIGSINAICASGSKKLLIVENTSVASSSSSSSSFSSSSSSFSSSSSSSSSKSSFSSSSSSFSSSSSSFSSSSSSYSFSSSSSSSSSSFSSSSSSSFSSSSSSFSSSSSSSSSSNSLSAGYETFEKYMSGDDTDAAIFDNNWRAQTFTPAAPHVVHRVALKLSRIGTGANVLTVSIKATTGGDPTGNDLASGSLATSDITGLDWYAIELGADVYVSAGVQYAMVVRQNGGAVDAVYWRYDNSDATYAGGTLAASDDAGATWVQDPDADFIFQEMGVASSSSSSSSFSSSSSSSSFSSSSSSSSFSSSSSSSSFSSSSSSSSSSFSSSSSSSSFSSSSSSSFSSSSSSFSSSSSSSSFSSSSSSSFSSSSSSFSSSSSSFSSSSSSSSESFSSSSSSSSFSSSSSSSSSLTLYENYTSGEDGSQDIYSDNWRAQSFTPSSNHTVKLLRLKFAREGVASQTLTASIKAVNGNGDPTGADLASGTLDTADISGAAAWYDISLGAGTALSKDTQYAIVVRQDGTYANRVYWRYDSTAAAYAGGVFIMSDDAGTTWTQNPDADFMFEEYGS